MGYVRIQPERKRIQPRPLHPSKPTVDYEFKGSVEDPFGNVLSHCWEGKTRAPNAKAAARNLAWQYKLQNGLDPRRTRVILRGRPVAWFERRSDEAR